MRNDPFGTILEEGNVSSDLAGKIIAADEFFSWASVVMQQRADALRADGNPIAAELLETDIAFIHAGLCAFNSVGGNNEQNN